jgi:hypothetical protein
MRVAGGRSSPWLGPMVAPGHDDLPRKHGRQEGSAQCARRSGRGGEERGVRMSVVELAKGGGTFYRAREAVGSWGGGRRRWSFNPYRF